MTAEPLPEGWKRVANSIVDAAGNWVLLPTRPPCRSPWSLWDGARAGMVHHGSLESCIEFAEGERKTLHDPEP